jgi:hypothetical protein
LLALLLIQILSLQTLPHAEPRYTPQQLTADFAILQSALISGDPGIYRFTQRTEVEAEFSRVRARLDRSMNTVEFYREIAPAVAAIKNGHTHLDWPEGFKKQKLAREPLLPLGVRVLQDDRVYVFRDFSSSPHDLAGSELLSINGRSAKSIVADIARGLSEDGDIPTSRRIDSSGLNFVESLPLVLGIRSPFTITVSKGGHQTIRAIAGKSETDLIDNWKRLYGGDPEVRKQLAAQFRILSGSSIAVMRISHWDSADDPQRMNLRVKFAEWFALMSSSNVKTLIIDVRHNGGGEDTMGTLLFSHLAQAPFLYYKAALANGTDFEFMKYVTGNDEKDALSRYVAPIGKVLKEEGSLPGEPTARYELVNRPNLGLQQPTMPHFGGRVLILIDGQSFSTSAEFAAIAHSSRRATFIGEETSGSYYGNDSGITPTVVLPNTKLRIDVPLIAYYMAVSGHRYPTRGVFPDCAITYSIADELEGRDKAMRAALDLAAGKHLAQCERIEY